MSEITDEQWVVINNLKMTGVKDMQKALKILIKMKGRALDETDIDLAVEQINLVYEQRKS